MPKIKKGAATGRHVYPPTSRGGGFPTAGALRAKALSGYPKTGDKTEIPKHTPKKAKKKSSMIWSSESYRKGQEYRKGAEK